MLSSRHRKKPTGWCVLAALLLALALITDADAQVDRPPLGTYDCFLIPSSTFVGAFTLTSPTHYVTSSGQRGQYRFDAMARKISWLSGPLAAAGWEGVYLPAETGRRSGHPATIVLKDKRDRRSPGEEGPDTFLYGSRRWD